MSQQVSTFDSLDEALKSQGPATVLQQLVQELRASGRHHELFEALKMKLRFELGLPLQYHDSGDELSDDLRQKLEDGLIDACREVGLLLMRSGKIRDGWMYLRPLGDPGMVLAELERQEPNDENTDEFIELYLQEGLNLERGFGLMLQHYGTCNSITTFESAMYGKPRAERAVGARKLVCHLHNELLENVRGHIERTESSVPPSDRLAELTEGRAWLFANGAYHVDTTHLSSVVRFARDLQDVETLRLALDLVAYGSQLDAQLQYPGDPPFADFYPAHEKYLQALCGERVDEAIGYFRQQAEAIDPYEDSTFAIEVYVDLLARVNRQKEALDESLRLLPASIPATGLAPSLLDLSDACGSYQQLKQVARQRDDLLGYAIGLLQESRATNNS